MCGTTANDERPMQILGSSEVKLMLILEPLTNRPAVYFNVLGRRKILLLLLNPFLPELDWRFVVI